MNAFRVATILALSATLAAVPMEPTLPGIGAAMQEMIARNEIAGAVTAVVTKDRVLHLDATGLADVAAKRPMTPDALFWIASMTKPVTGVAILMLQDEGKLAVGDPVAKYLPEFAGLKTPSGKPANLTLVQILTHTSGLGEAGGPAAQQARTLADLVPLWLAAPMQYEPGERWRYTQSGINAAARVVEVVSGMTFDAFVQQRILDPLGMKNTTFYPSGEQRARLATAYAKDKATGALNAVPPRSEFGPKDRPPQGHAGLFSTAPDYARFCQMLLSGGTLDGRRYLSESAMKFLVTPQTGDMPTGFFQNDTYGNRGANYGWGIATSIVRTPHDGVAAMLSAGTYGHGGAWGTQAWIDPVKGVAYVLMVQRSNFPNSDASDVRRAFQQAAADAVANTRPAPVAPPAPTGAPFDATKVPAGLPPPKMWTAQQDHQDMLDRLGIKALRPGPSGNESAPNHANYDEALANPYPNLPDVLTLKNGRKVTSAAMWTARRKEIVEEFDREVFGRVPANVPTVKWTVTRTVDATLGGRAVVGRALTGRVDNSAYPAIDVEIQMTLVTPKGAAGRVPVMMMFGGGRTLPGDPLPAGRGRGGPGFAPPAGADPPAIEQLIAAGWGYASINPGSIQADNGAGLTRGIIGLVNKGQPRRPDDWGSLRAWAWGASRGLDYLETDPTVDAARVGIEGVSRYGKAALATMAYDTRFAVVLIGSSGAGGAKPHRRNFGEAVENLTGRGQYHWMAGNFLKYGAAEATFGSRNAGDIPVDAHQLIALCAPRLAFVSYGVPEKGDAKWLDQQGSFMAAIAAQPVFRLLGARDLGRSDDYRTEKMPAVNAGLLDGHLAWRQHDGGHTDGPNWKYFIPWADKFLARKR